MPAFGMKLNFLIIFGCLILTLVCGDKVNTHKSPKDRPAHSRSHNLHRAPYEGYDWYKTYELNLDPIKKKSKKKNSLEDK